MIRRTIVRLAVLAILATLVLLTVADRLTESAAARAVSVKAREAGQLAADPTVTIAGFPFLNQALRGRYTRVVITTHGIHRSGLRLETVSGRFEGVHVGLGATLDGDLGGAHVGRATGEVEVTYADLDTFLKPRQLSIRAVGAVPALQLSARAVVGKTVLSISGPVQVAASAGVVSFRPTPAGLRAGGAALTAAQAAALAARLTVTVRLTDLPFGVQVRAAAAGPDGIVLSGPAVGLVVAVPADAAQTGSP